MEKKETAVKWLVGKLTIIQQEGLKDIIQQALEMEKEQIINSFEIGYENGACVFDGDSIYHGGNYYNQTYKSE